MSILDKALGALAPPQSEPARAEATAKARAATQGADGPARALDHHDAIRTAFEGCRAVSEPGAGAAAMKRLALALDGHALAEAVVLYPAMAKPGETGHAALAYGEPATAKLQMAAWARIDPGDEAWRDKLEHIGGAVRHHIFEAEGGWFFDLKRDDDEQAFPTRRLHEESVRYATAEPDDAPAAVATALG